jgi:hypothetical protein
VPGRPLAIWVLALVAVIAGFVTLAITLQFLEIIPWVGDEASFWGGKWAGVALYGTETFLFFAVAFGWLTLKPWAPMITLLFALFGFFVPFMSYLAGTELLSTALAPMIFSVFIILLSFRGPARQALAVAAAERNAPKPVKAAAKPAPAKAASAKSAPGLPPGQPRPKGFRADDV